MLLFMPFWVQGWEIQLCELHKGSEEFQIYEIFFCISSVHLMSSPIHPGEDFVLIEKMFPGERQVAVHTQETS